MNRRAAPAAGRRVVTLLSVSPDLHRVVAGRLRDDGQRYTENRRELVEVLLAEGQPITIPEILGRRDGLAQSSVYRNLTVLEKAGVVTKVVTNSEWGRYELAEDLTGHHHHLICSQCGTVRDIELPANLEQSISSVVAELGAASGFVIDEHRLDLVGRCEECVV